MTSNIKMTTVHESKGPEAKPSNFLSKNTRVLLSPGNFNLSGAETKERKSIFQ
jgi:hypothetical protein